MLARCAAAAAFPASCAPSANRQVHVTPTNEAKTCARKAWKWCTARSGHSGTAPASPRLAASALTAGAAATGAGGRVLLGICRAQQQGAGQRQV